LIVAHACSIDFNRPIIASTRARTCSFTQQAGAFDERFLPLAQGAIFFLDLADGRDKVFALLEPLSSRSTADFGLFVHRPTI
jgi:hypothetical protein